MLFDCGANFFESEKERNLYYKFFCGYFFNELIPGFENRLSAFCKLIANPDYPNTTPSRLVDLRATSTHVSFDNHAYLFDGCDLDGGEFADIFLHDRSTRTIVAIEAKAHSDFNYAKDIVANSARIKSIRDRLVDCHAVHCLLIKQSKWTQAQRMAGNRNSQFAKICADKECSTRVITWESFLAVCDDANVTAFLRSQLERRMDSLYYFKDGWFERR